MDWYQMKLALVEFTGLDMDALHVHAGVLVQLTIALLARRSLASPSPWLAILSAELANEWWDLHYETWPDRDQQYGESLKDLWNTMLLPTIMFLGARYRPSLIVSSEALASDQSEPMRISPEVAPGLDAIEASKVQ